MQQENPQLYSSLTTNLGADEQAVIRDAIQQAEVQAQAALQMAAQAAQNPQGVPGAPNGGAR